ncbi:thiamine biosynthesis protein ThiS [Spirochaeta thermophila DSM 6578]|uniref:Thiamine biosynthesis protein ThiS n=1 Tax=Winmispira thermophila (strain ATCC 700085 / DSM 6578 / Z-1203) TaxID=869211 RepID=G0GC59_WINT7|nr:sulfur carrier protein ThiS [Spirochaeta thermophila]AEJ60423.1 thiamine biosynthesis protein ThiS [Spirochaeta thermophila DSM 6578]
MRLIVNGEWLETGATTVGGLLEERGILPERVVVELEGRIVPREEFERTPLSEGARVEIVSFVGGG